MSTNERFERAGRFSVSANKRFMDENRELMPSFDASSVSDAMLAYIKLHFRNEIAEGEPSVEFYLSIQQRAFLSLYDREAINPVFPITDLGEDAIQLMRRSTGIGLEALPPPPPPVLSATQQLEQQVAADFKGLSSKQFKDRLDQSKAYRECYRRIAESDAIEAGPTRLIIGA